MKKYIFLFQEFAKAILSFFKTQEQLARISSQNYQLLKIFKNYPEMDVIFHNMTITKEEKIIYLNQLFAMETYDLFYQNGLKLFVERGYSPFLYELLQTIDAHVIKLLKTRLVEVKSAYPLTLAQKTKLEFAWRKKMTNQLFFQYYVVPEMILGISIHLDDYVEEYSLNSNLNSLKEKIKKGTIGH